jgi:hypothetical protein
MLLHCERLDFFPFCILFFDFFATVILVVTTAMVPSLITLVLVLGAMVQKTV